MRRHMFAVVAVLSGLAALSGCASSGGLSDADRLGVYQSAAGEPVSSFSYLGRISSWTLIDDQHIAVWTRPSEAWLLRFHGRCQDIGFAQVIGLTSQGSRVYAGFDKVMVHSPASIQIPCRIREIRPLDAKRLKAEEKAARQGAQGEASGT